MPADSPFFDHNVSKLESAGRQKNERRIWPALALTIQILQSGDLVCITAA
jgi:hypothetical protein